MTNTKATKRALGSSVLALFLCFAMLLGTTFAWFTDSVTSANNVITAGNLDVELEYWKDGEWHDVKDASDILTNTLWEPGTIEVAYLRVANAGSLAFKYQLGINIVSETAGVNKAGDIFLLSNYIMFGVVEGVKVDANKTPATYGTREDAVGAVKEAKKISIGYSKSNTLYSKNNIPDDVEKATSEEYIALVVYMPETVGNEANAQSTDTRPTINLGINVFATQTSFESDSFNANYDKEAAVSTVDEAEAMFTENKDVTLLGCEAPDSVLNVPANYSGTLTLVNSTLKSIQAEGSVNIVIFGNVVVNAKDSGVATVAADEEAFDGSAITAKDKLNISGNGTLTAIAADMSNAFGIGGRDTTEINIKDVTIVNVMGGHAYGVGADTNYYKDAPEGGAAIGSKVNGATITLENVTVKNAIGGSKAAGIGASFHTGVIVTIKNSNIEYVEGGVSAAGIGSSRVSRGAKESDTKINITKSTVNAVGGAYGAGIGSGYDTYCGSNQPLCTINITDSVVTAKGGKYAAGIGTGYHNAALAGEIKNSDIKAVSSDKYYDDNHTEAMGVGFGVVNPNLEAKDNTSYIKYNDEAIFIPTENPPVLVKTEEELSQALANGKNAVLEEDVKTEADVTAPYGNKYAFKLDGGVLDGNGNELYMECYGDDYGIMTSGGTVKNITITEGCRAIMIMYATEDIILDNVNIGGDGVLYPINTGEHATVEGVDLIVTNSVLAGWTSYSNIESASFTNVEFKQGTYYNNIYGRVLKPYVNTTLTNCSFVEHMNLDLSGLVQGQKVTFTNCTVNGQTVTADVFTVPATDEEYDTALFTVDLPSWATSINDCVVFN